jgi:hypothetical protein
VYNRDTHILRQNRNEWYGISYGTRLWKAKRDDDPELLKLSTLIDKLHFDPDSDEKVDGAP